MPDQQTVNLEQGFSANKRLRNLGSIYTPLEIAKYLTSWAIQDAYQNVLDLGIGNGVFTFAAYDRLLNLGAQKEEAQLQIYGVEKYIPAYESFRRTAGQKNVEFPNIDSGDFFQSDFPQVGAVVGNPPYVRRTYIENIDQIRNSIANRYNESPLDFSRLTDLYVYFLVRASSFLKPGGKLAVVTADSWLNVVYGQEFKRYLQTHFEIEKLVSLDRRVFEVDVKPVLLLATKKISVTSKLSQAQLRTSRQTVSFIRVRNGLPINMLGQSVESLKTQDDIVIRSVKQQSLRASHPWSIHFKAPEIYEQIVAHELMMPFSEQSITRLGIQTLAKDFFVLTPEEIQKHRIEEEFLEPLAHSIRSIEGSIIQREAEPSYYLFYCSKSREELKGTEALNYISQAEKTEVPVRGKNEFVIGYHNKERIKSDRRKQWYDLKSTVERRGRARILIPRLVYRNFTVVWNKGEYVPGELFIEFLPLASDIDTEVYLAILSSSVTEIVLRLQAQVYGGGTYNIAPGQIKKLPLLDATKLTNIQKDQLKSAYRAYISDANCDKMVIDRVVYDILAFDTEVQSRLDDLLTDMHLLAKATRGR